MNLRCGGGVLAAEEFMGLAFLEKTIAFLTGLVVLAGTLTVILLTYAPIFPTNTRDEIDTLAQALIKAQDIFT